MIVYFNSSTSARRFANRMVSKQRFVGLHAWLDLFGDKVYCVVYR